MFRFRAGKCLGSEQESVKVQSRKVLRFRPGKGFMFRAEKCLGLEQESVWV